MKTEPNSQQSCQPDPVKTDSNRDDGTWLSREDVHDVLNEVQAIRLGISLITRSDLDDKASDETKTLLEASLCRVQQIIDAKRDD
jgi:hypothetical protein